MNLTDHAGVRLTHGKPRVNGVEIHYAIGGAGEPVFLLHGTPKTMSYWRHLVPLLTPHYTVIAVDNRGAGGSQRPVTGYDTATMAGDVAELATHLGFDQFRVAGEDWGAAIAYAVAAFHRPRVRQLVFQETLLPGLPARLGSPGGENDPSLAADDIRTGWHFSFFGLPNVPELLLAGRERPFWTWYARRQMWDPSALTEEDIDEIVHSAEQPGGTRAILEMYRARQTDARITPTRSAARSWPSARRSISGTKYPRSSRKWPATSGAPSSPRPVTTSRWRTRPPWPRPTSTSSQTAKSQTAKSQTATPPPRRTGHDLPHEQT
jgi:pimeloyl-ACP methyl ester carboxylesterase